MKKKSEPPILKTLEELYEKERKKVTRFIPSTKKRAKSNCLMK